MSHAPRDESSVQPHKEGARPALRDVPGLSLRFGRHLTAWLLWHTSRVSLLDDAPPPADFDRAARA